MSKETKEKKAPKGEMTLEAAQKKHGELKADKAKAWKLVSGFRLKNKYKKGEKFKDKAIQKEHDALEETYTALKKEFDKVEGIISALKPSKPRNSKYEYPKDCSTPDQKKKFRAQQRAMAKADEKADKKASKKKEEPKAEAPKADKKKDKKKTKKSDD